VRVVLRLLVFDSGASIMRIVAPVGWCLIKGPDDRAGRRDGEDSDVNSDPLLQSGWRKQEVRLGRRHHDQACEEILRVSYKAGVKLPGKSTEAKLAVAEMLERYADRASVEVNRVHKDLAKKFGVTRSLSLAPSTATKKRGKAVPASASDARALTPEELLKTLTALELGPIDGLEQAHQHLLQQTGPSAALVNLVAARSSGQATFASLGPFASTDEYCSTLPTVDPITSDEDDSSSDSSATPARRKRKAVRRKPAAARGRRAAAAVDSESDAEPPVKRKPGRPRKLKADGQSSEKQPRRTAAAAAAEVDSDSDAEPPVKRKPGRPRKLKADDSRAAAAQATPAVASGCSEAPAVQRKPGRPKKLRSDGTHRHDRFERRTDGPERPRRSCAAEL
jgi:hypothetical protein